MECSSSTFPRRLNISYSLYQTVETRLITRIGGMSRVTSACSSEQSTQRKTKVHWHHTYSSTSNLAGKKLATFPSTSGSSTLWPGRRREPCSSLAALMTVTPEVPSTNNSHHHGGLSLRLTRTRSSSSYLEDDEDDDDDGRCRRDADVEEPKNGIAVFSSRCLPLFLDLLFL